MRAVRTRALLLAGPAALVLAAAAACGSSGSSVNVSSGSSATVTSAATASGGASAGSTATATGSSSVALEVTTNSSLGQIVTTSSGMTVYRYDADSASPSKSNCSGQCLTAWPPVLASGSGTPQVSGVSSKLVGEITRSDGTKQLTLDGWPLYTYAGDSAAGQVVGQGLGGTWWAVTPTGAKAGSGSAGKASSAASSSASSAGGSGW